MSPLKCFIWDCVDINSYFHSNYVLVLHWLKYLSVLVNTIAMVLNILSACVRSLHNRTDTVVSFQREFWYCLMVLMRCESFPWAGVWSTCFTTIFTCICELYLLVLWLQFSNMLKTNFTEIKHIYWHFT